MGTLTDRYLVTNKHFYQKVLWIFVPVLLQSVINQGVNMMDTIMVGQLGEASISASSLANQYYNLYFILGMGISAAGLVLGAQYWGAGNREAVKRVFDLMIQIMVLSGVLFSALTWFFPRQIMSIYTDEEDVIREGIGYLRVTAFIFLPHGVSLIIANIIRSVGNAKLGLYTSLISFVVNIGANYVLIFGKLGFPALGVTGAALGTLIARAVEFVTCYVYLRWIEKELRYDVKGLLIPPARALLREFKRLGLPAVISDFILGVAMTAVSIILGHMGKEVVSANAIVSVMDRMCTIAVTGIASASGVVIGHSVGEGSLERAQKEGWTFLWISILTGIFGSIIMLVVGEWTIGLYVVTEATRAVTVHMMEASVIIVFFMSVQTSLSKGILRGGGDTRFLMVADILFQWCASIPLGWLTGLVLHWEPQYVLLMLRIDYLIKTIWLIYRLKSGKWIHQVKRAV